MKSVARFYCARSYCAALDTDMTASNRSESGD